MSSAPSASTSCSAKSFLLGEYAVLRGLPAWIATFSPRFVSDNRSESEASNQKLTTIHPQSPAGRYLRARAIDDAQNAHRRFMDPFLGVGGFGASTAQFLLVHESDSVNEIWQDYRALFSDQKVRPSGADLVAQKKGGLVFFQMAGNHFEAQIHLPPGQRLPIAIFSAAHLPGRKTNTHENLTDEKLLSRLASAPLLAEWDSLLSQAKNAFAAKDARLIGDLFNQYAESLHRAGLESKAARADRLALRDLSGVFGVKGSGALLSDSVLIAYDSTGLNSDRLKETEWYRVALSRGLVCVSSELELGHGVLK